MGTSWIPILLLDVFAISRILPSFSVLTSTPPTTLPKPLTLLLNRTGPKTERWGDSYWLFPGDIILLVSTLDTLVQPATDSLHCALAPPPFLRPVHKNVLSNSVRRLAEIQVRRSHSPVTPSGEGTRLGCGDLCQSRQPLGHPCFPVPELTDQPVMMSSRVLPGINTKLTALHFTEHPFLSLLPLLLSGSSSGPFENGPYCLPHLLRTLSFPS